MPPIDPNPVTDQLPAQLRDLIQQLAYQNGTPVAPPCTEQGPLAERPAVVAITVMWELSWYRYEVDLSDEAGGVRRDAQGDELSELSEDEQVVNAAADDRGGLHLQ